jgi:hypothetical protein
MKQRLILTASVLLWIVLASQPSLAQMSRPDHQYYPNPYSLMTRDSIEFNKGINWYVLGNRKNASISQSIGGSVVNRAGYLELFSVEARKGKYLKVKSLGRENVVGWMDMRHLILLQQCIKAPDTMVFHKIFIRVRVDEPGPFEPGLNSLRFRNGPGEGGMEYDFLTSPEETVREGGLFFYLYGVHFKDRQINYQDTFQFNNADYFLIGDQPSFSISGRLDESGIRGWLPRRSVVFWNTRQALEVVPGRLPHAHKFRTRPLLYKYFDQKDYESRRRFIEMHSDEIIIDNGEAPPVHGQELRNIVLGVEHKYGNLTSEYIGYTGKNQYSTGSQQSFLADLHEGASHIEIFFLIDATQSMKPCLDAASWVIKQIMNKTKDKDINLTFHGAVYRDISAGKLRFEEWDPAQNPVISSWFNHIHEFDTPQDNEFEESLFYGIKQSIKSWRSQFKHRLSVRVMVILGDTGDNGKGPYLEEIVSLMKENMILPLAIHFKHEIKESAAPSQVEAEKKAIAKFFKDIKDIYTCIYDLPELIEIKSVEASSIERELERYINAAVSTVSEFVKKMPQIRLGQKSIKDQLCEMAYSSQDKILRACKACKTVEDLLRFLENHPPKGKNIVFSKAHAGFFAAYMNQLGRQNQDLKKMVVSYPETGFSSAYMALKQGNISFARPVLLLSLYELQDINYAIEEILTRYRYCEDKRTHQLLVKAMATILGEVLQVDPSQVSREELQRWFKLAVDPERTFLGTPQILESLCSRNNRNIWINFLRKLEKAKQFIRNLETTKSISRFYLDSQATPYFWVYPEEIFPPLEEINE